jgi:hypothetical protein
MDYKVTSKIERFLEIRREKSIVGRYDDFRVY